MSKRRVVLNSGVTLSVRLIGDGPRDVLLVHGWMLSGAVWDSALAHLNAQGVRWIVVDQRGSGESDKPATGYTLDHYIDDLVALLDALSVRDTVIVGHSMGAQIALALAAKLGERARGVCALCPVPPGGMTLPPDAAALFRTSANDPDKQRTILSLACKTLSPEERDRLVEDASTVSAACVEQAFDAWTTAAITDRMRSVRAPTLVLATDDPFLPPAFLQDAVVSKLSLARLAILPGPGHYPQCERPAETAAIIEAFVTATLTP